MKNIINKALYQLGQGKNDEAIETLEMLIENQEEITHSVFTARCILGEYYSQTDETIDMAEEHLQWIVDTSNKLKNEYNRSDMLSIASCEIERAERLLNEIENFCLKDEELYKNGDIDGIFKKFNKNGKLERKSPYKKGKLNGTEKWFNRDKIVIYEIHYKNGRLDGSYKQFYDTGELYYEKKYTNDVLEGVSKWFYQNSNLQRETHYKSGKVDGIESVFFENGSLQNEIHYTKGIREIYKRFNKSGNLMEEKIFKQGKIKIHKRFYRNNGDVKIQETVY